MAPNPPDARPARGAAAAGLGITSSIRGPDMAPKPPDARPARGAAAAGLEVARDPMERETGFEPATPSLEGWRSTAELFPPVSSVPMASPQLVGRGGFEPPKAYASRFTVCPLWPLGYLPDAAGMRCETPCLTLALAGGFEPPTHCLQGSCSGP